MESEVESLIKNTIISFNECNLKLGRTLLAPKLLRQYSRDKQERNKNRLKHVLHLYEWAYSAIANPSSGILASIAHKISQFKIVKWFRQLIREKVYHFWTKIWISNETDELAVPPFDSINHLYEDFRKITLDALRKIQIMDPTFTSSEKLKAMRVVWFSIYWEWFCDPSSEAVSEQFPLVQLIGLGLWCVYTDSFIDNPRYSRVEIDNFISIVNSMIYFQPTSIYDKGIFSPRLMAHLKNAISMMHDNHSPHNEIFKSLSLLNEAQNSDQLKLSDIVNPKVDLNEILYLSCRKGFLALYTASLIVNNKRVIKKELEEYLASFGLFIQLLDDLQDVEEDLAQNKTTVFTFLIKQGKALDELISNLLNFIENIKIDKIINGINEKDKVRLFYLDATFKRGFMILVLEAIGKLDKKYFTCEFFNHVNSYCPWPLEGSHQIPNIEATLLQVIELGL
ncbi:hypothetical protein ROZALSC1DRAFT_26957 [Rozella allomycis CSF55]|uniref:Uncharacterized protein n=1 Tax=Rozella allomycis (strain CSF55) TaxID=988480 RepID=A0A4V1J0I4_ROZAC|nr:hypothetical protein ROZALSC1DRAFT_26957 [Rozella allomycis CSF55]